MDLFEFISLQQVSKLTNNLHISKNNNTKIPQKMTPIFKEVAILWKDQKRQYVRPSTYATYTQLCNSLILPVFGDGPLPDEAAVQSFVTDLLGLGYAVKTVKDTVLVLKMIVRHGEKLGVWPTKRFTVHYPSNIENSKQVQSFQPNHINKLLKHITSNPNPRNIGLVICIFSGLRIGEICGLQWRDVDLREGVLRVNKTVQRIYLADGANRQYYVSVDRPKTNSSIREIPIPANLKVMLKSYKKTIPQDYYVISGKADPLEPRTYRVYFYRLLKTLGLPKTRFHALRHSFATRCIESKCDYKTVSAILGHSSIATTLNLYVHPGLSQKRKCIERLAKSIHL